MADQQPNPNSRRSAAMARAWATRKANAATASAWWQRPVCLCGCGVVLVRHRNPERQRFFRPGHDARLKSVAAAVLAGEIDRKQIPDAARALKDRLGFLKTRPELARAF